MKFTKMHGLGNDYIYIDATNQEISCPEELAKTLSDRHFGVGSDGLVLIMPSASCDFRMRMFNADGSEAEMCGNASRCIGKFVYDKRMTAKKTLTLETKAGIKVLELFTNEADLVETVRIDMGAPSYDEEVINKSIKVGNEIYNINSISMGNPHCIIFVGGVDDYDVEGIGKQIEVHPLFPEKTNVEFAEIESKDTIKMRVWERGSGETLACGTGACATLVAAVLNKLSNRKTNLSLIGGNLIIEWDSNTNHVFMTGPATTVFEGEL